MLRSTGKKERECDDLQLRKVYDNDNERESV